MVRSYKEFVSARPDRGLHLTATFPHLAQPLQLRHLTLRNRIVFGAHTANMSEAGLPGARHLGYYRERARGGAAMIVVEPVPVLVRCNIAQVAIVVASPAERAGELLGDKRHIRAAVGEVVVRQNAGVCRCRVRDSADADVTTRALARVSVRRAPLEAGAQHEPERTTDRRQDCLCSQAQPDHHL